MRSRPIAPLLLAASLSLIAGCASTTHPSSDAAASSTHTPTDTPTPTDSPTQPAPDPTSDSPTPVDTYSPAAPSDTYTPDPTTAAPQAPQGQQNGWALGTYNVTMTGTVENNQFQRTGTLVIRPTVTTVGTGNGVNPADVCLVSGFPAAQPAPGAVWFGSNSACDPGAGAADLDLAYVSVNGNTITVAPDERIAATGGNNFTGTSGLAACPYFPVSGQMSVTPSPDGSVEGTVNIVGYGGAMCGQVGYQAQISGNKAS